METEILIVISYIKYVSKKKVTDGRNKSELRKKDTLIRGKDFQTTIDSLLSSYNLELRGNDSKKMCSHRD